MNMGENRVKVVLMVGVSLLILTGCGTQGSTNNTNKSSQTSTSTTNKNSANVSSSAKAASESKSTTLWNDTKDNELQNFINQWRKH